MQATQTLKTISHGEEDRAVIMKKLPPPDFAVELKRLYASLAQRTSREGVITEEQIIKIVEKYRHG